MDKLKEMVTAIDLDNLLKLFDLQIAIGVLLFFILLRGVLSTLVIKIYYRLNPSSDDAYSEKSEIIKLTNDPRFPGFSMRG